MNQQANNGVIMAQGRSNEDRRQRHFRAFVYQFARQRRRAERRSNATVSYGCVDIHEPLLLLTTLTVLLLCVVDAFNTLILLDAGGVELNPFMNVLLERDALLFFGVKYGLTAIGLTLLVAHKHVKLFRLISGSQIIALMLIVYGVLIGHQYQLLSQL